MIRSENLIIDNHRIEIGRLPRSLGGNPVFKNQKLIGYLRKTPDKRLRRGWRWLATREDIDRLDGRFRIREDALRFLLNLTPISSPK